MSPELDVTGAAGAAGGGASCANAGIAAQPNKRAAKLAFQIILLPPSLVKSD
jgi:hypothetical protein